MSVHNKRTGVRAATFVKGDLVLKGAVHRIGGKLSVRCNGPLRVTRCLSDLLFELEDLLTGKRATVHGFRVSFFRNKDFQVTSLPT